MSFKSGFISVIGRPNVGKSSIINYLSGGKISIISSKPQTTRNTIKSIITTDKSQMIFIDTPGIHKPKNKLGEYMVSQAEDTLNEVDVVLFVTEAVSPKPGTGDKLILSRLGGIKTPVILVVNKIDLVKNDELLPLIANYSAEFRFHEILPVSAMNGEGMELIKQAVESLLPEGPEYFPRDMITDMPEKFIVAEIIREKLLELLSDESPHGTGVEVILFRERENKDIIDLEATIYCEKDSHKGIIIGKGGRLIKEIGTQARIDIERLLGSKVNLQLWVKTKQDWRNDNYMLKTLGYGR